MTETASITETLTNLNEAHERLQLCPTADANFFSEWQEELPTLTGVEQQFLDRLKQRYFYYAADGAITEGTVNLILLAPLLEHLGWCDPPYKVRGEKFIKIEIESGTERLQGLIDVLIVQDTLWLVLIESKRYGFSVMQALPQTLAYMAANPQLESPGFGLITTGEDYIFVKLDLQSRQYDVSDKLTLSTRRGNQLYRVVQMMRRLAVSG